MLKSILAIQKTFEEDESCDTQRETTPIQLSFRQASQIFPTTTNESVKRIRSRKRNSIRDRFCLRRSGRPQPPDSLSPRVPNRDTLSDKAREEARRSMCHSADIKTESVVTRDAIEAIARETSMAVGIMPPSCEFVTNWI
ncbi:unnamed protein product [Colias eurytheme]|nr:unnamed protein product [Colias eurytheme]